ncbi:hypothetical protein V8C26DRAFT_136999 [Trichoderma gracile]
MLRRESGKLVGLVLLFMFMLFSYAASWRFYRLERNTGHIRMIVKRYHEMEGWLVGGERGDKGRRRRRGENQTKRELSRWCSFLFSYLIYSLFCSTSFPVFTFVLTLLLLLQRWTGTGGKRGGEGGEKMRPWGVVPRILGGHVCVVCMYACV